MTAEKPVTLADTAEKSRRTFVAIITGMNYCWYEQERTEMSGGATTLCLDPSVRHLAPLMVECPTG